MIYVNYRSIFLLSISFLSGCTQLGSINNNDAMNQLVVTEPLSVNYKHEVALASLSQAILRADVSDAQRAEFYYQRGTYYDKVGLRTLAFIDFKHALKLKPDLVDAYNFLGIQYTQQQQFPQAFDAFDSALELDPNHEYAYLNRGIALLYYGDRQQLAKQDLVVFLNKQPQDPYRIIWLYFAEVAMNDVNALTNLKARSLQIPSNVWGSHIISLFLGEIPENELLPLVSRNTKNKKELIEKLCEAYFYLGKYNMIIGQPESASNYFRMALSTQVYEFVEHRYARLELDLMQVDRVETSSLE